MQTQVYQKVHFSLLFFLAERLLEQEYSVSFDRLEGLQVLFAICEKHQRIYVALDPEEFSEKTTEICNISSQFPNYQVMVPVLRQEQRQQALEWLESVALPNLKIIRLSLVDRFSYFNRQFLKAKNQDARAKTFKNQFQ